MLLDLLRSMYQSSVPARTVEDVVHDTVKDNSSKIDYSHRLLASERRRRRRRRLKAWKRTARHLFIGHSRNACGLQCNFPHYIIINFPSILRPPLSLSLSLSLSLYLAPPPPSSRGLNSPESLMERISGGTEEGSIAMTMLKDSQAIGVAPSQLQRSSRIPKSENPLGSVECCLGAVPQYLTLELPTTFST